MLKRLLCLFAFVPAIAWAGFVPAYTIMADFQGFEVKANSGYTQTRERKIRIETPQGIDFYGQSRIFYDGKRDKLSIFEAYTIKPDGSKVLVTPDRIKRISASTDDVAPYFTDQMVATIVFPQVEVGSQLYYKAVLEQNDPIITGRFGSLIAFTPHRRYDNATIQLTHPAGMPIQAYARGLEGVKRELPDGRIQYVYQYKEDAVYPLEPGQVEYEDFAPVVQFSNYKDYADLARVTQALFQPKTQVTPNVQRLADELTQGAKTPRQKAQRLYDWVSKNIRYVGIDVGASGFEPHFADEILEHGYGDCKDHATLLEALLMAVGIPSSPVLIKTAESYVVPHLAGKYYFDHVITYVPEFDLYLDSTAQFAEFGTLPPADMGKPTLITQTGTIGATPNSDPKYDYTVTQTKLRLMPDGSIVGTSKFEPRGYYTTMSRSTQFSYENRDTQSVVDSILKRFQETGTGELIHGDPNDLSSKWRVTSSFKLDPVINLPGPSAFAVPTGLAPGFIKSAAAIKPYTGRRYPFSCGSDRNVEQIEISFPENVRVTRIPQGIVARTNDQSYRSTYKLAGNKLYATREMVTQVHTDVCQPSPARTKELTYMLNQVKADLRSQVFIE
ncbi:MAG: hypothetical protein RIQ55_986 [Pseudomonadota bacterium]|jgi:transglutaminase-like putative cysteine protease